MDQNNKVFDWGFKLAALLALPAFYWALSLSAERASTNLRLEQLEERIRQCEESSSELTRLVQSQKEEMGRVLVTLDFIRQQIQDVRDIVSQDRSAGR